MGILDVDSLFTNIPLDKIIDICINQLFKYTDTVEAFTKSELKQQRSLILYLTVYFTNIPMVQQCDHFWDPPWITHLYHTMKKKMVK